MFLFLYDSFYNGFESEIVNIASCKADSEQCVLFFHNNISAGHTKSTGRGYGEGSSGSGAGKRSPVHSVLHLMIPRTGILTSENP